MRPRRYYASVDVSAQRRKVRVPRCTIMRVEAHCGPCMVIGMTQDKGEYLTGVAAAAIILRDGDTLNFIPEQSATHFYAKAFGGPGVKKPHGSLVVTGLRRKEPTK